MSRTVTPANITPAHGLPDDPPAPTGIYMCGSEAVLFTAACPACGRDVDWVEEREETHLRIAIGCDCHRRKRAA